MSRVLFLTAGAKIGRAISFCRSLDGMAVALAWFAFALIHAKNVVDFLKPPGRVGEVGSGLRQRWSARRSTETIALYSARVS